MIIATVKTFEDKSPGGDKLWYVITDEKGHTHNIFSSNVPDLASKRDIMQPGCTVKLTKVKNKDNPKWWDTIKIEQGTASDAVNNDKSGTFAESALRQRSIEKQNALTNAVNLWCAVISKSTSAIDPVAVEDKVLKTADKFYEHTSTKAPPPEKEKDEPLFEGPPKYSIKTQFDYEKSVKTLAGKLGFTTIKHLSEFISANSKMLPGTAWKSYDDGLKAIFIALLQKEVENRG